MSDFLAEVFPAIRAIIAATFPEMVANGIWESEHVDRVPWADIPVPYAVIDMSSAVMYDFGGTNDCFAPVADLYLVQQVNGPVSGIRANLVKLKRALEHAPQTTLQVMDFPSIGWDEMLKPNQELSLRNSTVRAGRLQVRLLVGESVNAV